MPFSNYALNMMATHLAEFKEPNIPDLTLEDDRTLQLHLLENTLGAFGGEANRFLRHQMTNIVRRVFASIETYRLGRKYAYEYVTGDRHSQLARYFSALTQFEMCVAYSWQVCDLLVRMNNEDLFAPGDDSAWERLHDIYTIGTKHSFGHFKQDDERELPTSIWLTNDGVCCISGRQLAFAELCQIVAAANSLFYRARDAIRDRH